MKIIYDIETTGLNPMKDRITCIGLIQLDKETPIIISGENEKEILIEFFNNLKKCSELVSFNGDSFDIPFIIKRALILKVTIIDNFLKSKSVDLRKIANSFFYSYNKYEKGSLNDWSNILLNEDKKTNGKEVIEAFNRKDWKLINKHCSEDVIITKLLYQRCQECNLL